MKRLNGLHDRICTLQNIEEADKNARKGKHNWGIIKHDQHAKEDNEKTKITDAPDGSSVLF